LLDHPSIEGDVVLANHIAYVHSNKTAPIEEGSISLDYLRRHVEHAKTFEPKIPRDLSKYIVAAYVQMREEGTKNSVTP
jgi:DNA replication licensing factor MCM7